MKSISVNRSCHRKIIAMLVPLAVFSGNTLAQDSTSISRGDRPIAVATAIEKAQAPKIDGNLDEAIWAKARVIDAFHQVEPVSFATPSERTEVRILYDHDRLYVALHAFDSEPDKITATVKERDGPLPRDDFMRVFLDPQRSRRNGYMFEVSPLGGHTDALLQNNTQLVINWNSLWEVRTRIVEDGWTAEMAIPFRSLSYDENSAEWGLDIVRQIKRKSETLRWSPAPSSVALFDISLAGTLTQLTGMSQGAGLDLKVYGLARYTRDWNAQNDNVTFEPSGTAYYKITPSLTGTLTAHPDFSDAPLDTRRVNTTRFTLFEPETRDFFLQDASAFEFGGQGFYNAQNGQPFFSRNIGLVDGKPVDIRIGAKVSGTTGPLRIGALTAKTADQNGIQPQTLSVVRLAANVLDESAVGVVATRGDPTGSSTNSVIGADFQYRNSDIGAGKRLLNDWYFQRSYSNVRGDDNAFGVSVVYPNEPWSGELHFKQIGADFFPALGFVNRTNIREYRGGIKRISRLNDAPIRWLSFSSPFQIVTDLNDTVQSRRNTLAGSLFSSAGDLYTMQIHNEFENIATSFDLPGSVAVPAGRYRWTHFNPVLESSAARPLFGSWKVDCCNYLNGHYFQNDLTLTYRPNGTYEFAVQHVLTSIRMPTGEVEIRVAAAEIGVKFTPDMQLRTQLQYDTISQRFGGLIRFRWEYRPDTEIFAALGETALADGPLFDSRYHSQTSEVVLRLGHQFQF